MRLSLLALIATCAGGAASPQVSWDRDYYDPGAAVAAPADLILPMPCGGAMAFQSVQVSIDGDDPLDDARVRLGQSDGATRVTDYLRFEYLGAPFAGTEGTRAAYYIARYELMEGQHDVLVSETCPEITRRARLAKSGLSWFEAVDIGRRYTEWLLQEGAEALPQVGEEKGFLRLPTEAEWEYAARGGIAVDAAAFAQPRFPMDGDITEYARVSGGTVRGPGPTAITQPNPLGLYDMYGNVEELMLEPFRLNVAGRSHGQPGGVVTRGGSFATPPSDVSSALRTEWRSYDARGQAQAQEGFGVRFVLSATASGSDQKLRDLEQSFERRMQSSAPEMTNPLRELDRMIENELQPDRQQALQSLKHSLVEAAGRAEEADAEVIRATLNAAMVLLNGIREESAEIVQQGELIRAIEEFLAGDHDTDNPDEMAQVEYYSAELEKARDLVRVRLEGREMSLDGYRDALDLFANDDLPPDLLDGTQRGVGDALSARGASEMNALLDSLLIDIDIFSEHPDMQDDELLGLALQ